MTLTTSVISSRESLFCHSYAESGNKAKAAKTAGYGGNPSAAANRLLKRSEINDYIDQLIEERESLRRITATGVIVELAKTAFFDFAEMVDCLQENGSLDKENWSTDARSAVSSVKVTKTYREVVDKGCEIDVTTEIKTWDRLRALKMLGDHVGAFTDLNVAIAVLRTYGINLAKVDGEWQVMNDGGT